MSGGPWLIGDYRMLTTKESAQTTPPTFPGRPISRTTWYYAPVGKAFAEIPVKADAQRFLKVLPKAAKGQ